MRLVWLILGGGASTTGAAAFFGAALFDSRLAPVFLATAAVMLFVAVVALVCAERRLASGRR